MPVDNKPAILLFFPKTTEITANKEVELTLDGQAGTPQKFELKEMTYLGQLEL